MTPPLRFLLICGSLQAGSSSAALLKTALELLPATVNGDLYGGLSELPRFSPNDDVDPYDSSDRSLHPAVVGLRRQISEADALLFSTPEYAGALPGSFKNLLDWTVGGGEMYRKPVAWFNAAAPAAPTDSADAHTSLEKVLGYVGADIAEPACIRIPVERHLTEADGQIHDPELRKVLADALMTLATYIHLARLPA